jgi:TRAP-type C4-dicarboxylate transport system substrate-binding protein
MIPLEEEKFMIKLHKLALAGVVAGAFAAPSQAQTTTLTFSTWVPPTHHLSVWQRNWAADLEKATAGRIKVQELPKAPAAPPGTFDAVKDGLVDFSYVTASYTPARHILPLMAELPGAGSAEVITALGGSPFFKPAPESYELLNSGVADGVFFPFESIVSFKLDKVIGQATVFPGGLYSSSFGFFMNQEKWNKLSKQDQDIIEKMTGEFAARSNGKSWDAADKVGLDALKAAGANIVTADAAMRAEAKKQATPIIDDWIKKASVKVPNAKAILDEFHAELKKVEAGK